MVDCDVIKDLIPLVNDDVASGASKKMVNNHCEGCSDCRRLLAHESGRPPEDDRIIRALKRSVLTTQIVLLAAGILISPFFPRNSTSVDMPTLNSLASLLNLIAFSESVMLLFCRFINPYCVKNSSSVHATQTPIPISVECP